MTLFNTWKKWAKLIKEELKVLYLAYLDPRTPLYAKILIILTLAYALSPIDLIPDFIPIIGYLDDLIIVPIGIFLSIRMIPKYILEECRLQVDKKIPLNTKLKWFGLSIILSIWILILLAIISWMIG